MNSTRRGFIAATTGTLGALVIGWHQPRARASGGPPRLPATLDSRAEVNTWLRIGTDGAITITLAHAEMGQGVYTGLAMAVAEELEADWSRVRVEQALASPVFGTLVTAASNTTETFHERLRHAGATAREMLKQAAAAQWRVPVDECTAANSRIVHAGSGRSADYGSLVPAASRLAAPAHITLKAPSEWRLLGKEVRPLDTPAKVSGRAQYGIDVVLPGLLYGAAVICPVQGGKLVGVDDRAVHAMRGVHSVVPTPDAVVVLADSTWAALQAAEKLEPKWDLGPLAVHSSVSLDAEFARLLETPGVNVLRRGDPSVIATAPRYIEAVYDVPYLAHHTLEPVNATVRIGTDGVDVWAPTQGPLMFQMITAQVLGVPPERVRVHATFLGGGFGRKASPDFLILTALAAKASKRPVKLTYSRTNDLRHDYYRPKAKARLAAHFDRYGAVLGLDVKLVAQSVSADLGAPFDGLGGVDFFTAEGLTNLRYDLPQMNVEYVNAPLGLRLGALRSIGAGANAFFVESFVDEIAAALGRDPLGLRRELLADSKRSLAVLDRAAQEAGWGRSLRAGHHQGMAIFEYHGTIVAEVAEVSITPTGEPKVHRVTVAADPGRVLNPVGGRQQVEGSVVFGLSDAMHGDIRFEEGAVIPSNFHEAPLLRLPECPRVDVHFVESGARVTGLGEPAVPPLAPAVANAIFAASGRRIRSLPFLKT